MRLAADLLLLLGGLFSLLGALGLLRMPDVYNRIQAGTKAATLGALSFLLGVGLLYPQWWAKLLCIAGFVLLTNPIGSSTIARALYLSGVRPWVARGAGTASPTGSQQTGESSP
jgi:multicomponent Na+:H+ antiporter subunit G